ncbi:MAG: NAD-binding protein [Coriobacteriia bacterium]|nr:NAD-binding protein [Coriobacteriia bacterium]
MKTKVFLIGGFDETVFLANSLIKKGYLVTAINNDLEVCQRLAEIDRLEVFHGDGSHPDILDEANIYDTDIAIALTDRDDDNLVILELCKKKFNVRRTISLISDPKKTDFFRQMGIDVVISAVSMIASILELYTTQDEMTSVINVGQQQIKVTQIHIPRFSPIVDKTLLELWLPEDVVIGCVIRNDVSLPARDSIRVQADDVLLLISDDKIDPATIRDLTGRIPG